MKKIILFLILILGFFDESHGQSILLQPVTGSSSLPFIIKKDGIGLSHENADGSLKIGTYVTNAGAFFQTHNNIDLNFSTNSGSIIHTLRTNGDFGVGTQSPTAKLHIFGTSKLGSDASPISMLEFTGTTAATQGSFVTVNHGLNELNIISVHLSIDSGGGFVTENSTHAPGYQVGIAHDPNVAYILNKSGNSNFVVNKPFKLIIIYRPI